MSKGQIMGLPFSVFSNTLFETPAKTWKAHLYVTRLPGDRGGWRRAMRCMIIQATWEMKSIESTQHRPQSLLHVRTSDRSSFLPSLLAFLFAHLAAFQSRTINIQRLRALSSHLSKWHNPWRTAECLLYATFSSSTFTRGKLCSY